MAGPDFTPSIDRRTLLVSSAAVTAASIVPSTKPAYAAAPDFFQPSPLTHKAAPANFCAATARRLAQIERRNAIRQNAGLPLLSIPKELRQMKEQEELMEFERFAAANGRAVLEEVLKARRKVEGSNWRPINWIEGMRLQNQVRKMLSEQLGASRQVASVHPVEAVL